MKPFKLTRRKAIFGSLVAGGGLVLGISLTRSRPFPIDRVPGDFVPNAFLQITPDNVARFYCPRDEMGQGVTTGLGTIVAEELDVDPHALDIVFAGVHSAYDNPTIGSQVTGGSCSLSGHFLPLRQLAADTRAMILAAAAIDLGADVSELTTEDGHVLLGGQRYPYGQFASAAAELEAPDNVPLKDADQFRHIGRSFPRLDAVAKSTGTATYAIDIDIPGMHHAVVRRSPVFGAKLNSVDLAVAKRMPGVTDVVEISSGVAVVAEKYWQARQAADVLKPEFETVELGRIDAATIRSDHEKAMGGPPQSQRESEGDIEEALASAAVVVESEYWAPMIAHATMEPMSAVIRIEDGEAELWVGTQSPPIAQGIVQRVADLPAKKVRVHNTYLGGGFGRRSVMTHVAEVTEIAKATRKPIHLLWSREDDLRHGIYRPPSLMKIKAGVDDQGSLSAWQATRVGGNVLPDTLRLSLPAMMPSIPDGIANAIGELAADVLNGAWPGDPTSAEGLAEGYDFANFELNHTTVEHGIPLTIWRSVGHSYTAFAKESMIDELAEKAGIDPVEFRLANTKGNPRLHNVIKVAAEQMRRMKPGPDRHLGFAANHSFGSSVAQVAEVSVADGTIRVHKVICVVDCGLVVNPEVAKAQMEGAVAFGLSAALHGELTVDGGAIQESNFHDYNVLRMDASPQVEVVFAGLDDSKPTGVGEPGVPVIAPAVANAVYRATGQRLRSLPLRVSS